MGACASTPESSRTSFNAESSPSFKQKPTEYAKNQVVPETSERSVCAASSNGFGMHSTSKQMQRQGPSKEAQQMALSRYTFLKDLTHACEKEAACSNLYLALIHLAPRASHFLTEQEEKAGGGDTDALQLAARACASCLDRIYEPVVACVERILSNEEATTSASDKNPRWGSLTGAQVLETLDAAAQTVYPKECISLHNLGKASLPAAEMLLQLWAYCIRQSTMDVGLDTFHVPAVDRFAALLGIAWFKKVTLDPQPVMNERAHHMTELLARLHWKEQHFACCLSPSLGSMMMQVQQAAQKGAIRVDFVISRSRAFWDAFKQAEAQGLLKAGSVACMFGGQVHMVFPSFLESWAEKEMSKGGELTVEAGEGHGPRKEFFQLAGEDMCRKDQNPADKKPLFIYNRTAGAFWFNATLQEDSEYKAAFSFAGWLIGQSLLNRAPLCVNFPPLMFQQLLHQATSQESFEPDMRMLRQYDPHAAVAIENVASLSPDQFNDMLAMEGLEGHTPEQYQQKAVNDLLVGAVKWQAEALGHGLLKVLGTELLAKWCMGPEALALAVSGTEGVQAHGGPVDMREMFRVVMDEELSAGGGGEVVGELLWEVLNCWSVELQTAFLNFVTGTSRLPAPGSELLKVECPFVALSLAESKQQLGMLPQAHTCDNLLEVPNYWEALLRVKGIAAGGSQLLKAEWIALRAECHNIVDERLRMAVLEGSKSYGLDQRARSGKLADDPRWVTSREGSKPQANVIAAGNSMQDIEAPQLGRSGKTGQFGAAKEQQGSENPRAHAKGFLPKIIPMRGIPMGETLSPASPSTQLGGQSSTSGLASVPSIDELPIPTLESKDEASWVDQQRELQRQQEQQTQQQNASQMGEGSQQRCQEPDSGSNVPVLPSSQGPSWGHTHSDRPLGQQPLNPEDSLTFGEIKEGDGQGEIFVVDGDEANGGRGEHLENGVSSSSDLGAAGQPQRTSDTGTGSVKSRGTNLSKGGDDEVHAFGGNDDNLDALMAECGEVGST